VWAWQAIGLGVYAFFIASGIIWVTNLHIQLLFPWDRFTLIAMFGACLLVAGMAALIERPAWLSAVLLSGLLALAAGLQFQHRLVYRQEWLAQRNFLWQLAWRAPALEPGTLLMTSELPFLYYSDNSLTAPLNWMYAPENRSTQMPYLLYDVEARLGVELPAIAAGLPIEMRYRATTFSGSTSKAIVLFYDPPRCLKIVDPGVDRFLPVKPLYIREMTPLSQLDRVSDETDRPAAPPESLFGAEPAHAWCYYFEKAELYNQFGEWEQAAAAADQALKITKQFTDKNVSELFAFIEAYAHTGKWKRAVDLSLQAYNIWDKTQYPLCDVWARIQAQTTASAQQQSAVQNVKESLKCKAP
jgi:tetratricopeptide (TPR) repeat protein